MAKRELLDCTLRDCGYVNDWEFGHDKIVEIFKRLVSSGVEYIEVGFLDDRRKFDINRTIMPNTQAINKIFGGLNKGNATVLGMIDYGTCSIDHIQPCKDTFIDGIRVIFKEHLMYDALAFCKQLKDLGYIVFAQMVSVTTYTDEKLKEYSKLVNSVMPYATSMVDTYGLTEADQIYHIYSILDKYIEPKVKIGFHAHNNFQLAFANAMAFLNYDSKRNLLVDGTLYAMGKSAGNAALELLMMYMNQKYSKHYDINQVLEAIDNVIMDIYHKQYWGYNMKFYISAETKCHPNYVSYYLDKKTLSVKQIMELLESLKNEKKLLYDKDYAEQMYLEYQSIRCDDRDSVKKLTKILKGKNILLLGPGNSIKRQKKRVDRYIDENEPLVISVNYVPKDTLVQAIFLTNSKRYTELMNTLDESVNKDVAIIATSNVYKTNGAFTYVLNYENLIDKDTEIADNSLVMLLKAMINFKVKKVFLAGFDGYSKRRDNYFEISREYSYVKEKADYLNTYVREFLEKNRKKIDAQFITRSHYNKKEKKDEK